MKQVLLLLVVLCFTSLMHGQAYSCIVEGQPYTNFQLHQAITETLTTCGNQQLPVGGEYLYEWHCAVQPNGDTHVHWISHYNLTGTDANGINYQGSDQQGYELKMDPDASFPPAPTASFRSSDRFRLDALSPGVPSMKMTQQLSIAVDANGNAVIQRNGNPVLTCK